MNRLISTFLDLPPIPRCICIGIAAGVFLLLVRWSAPHEGRRFFDLTLAVRYLSLGGVAAAASYLIYLHRDGLAV